MTESVFKKIIHSCGSSRKKRDLKTRHFVHIHAKLN